MPEFSIDAMGIDKEHLALGPLKEEIFSEPGWIKESGYPIELRPLLGVIARYCQRPDVAPVDTKLVIEKFGQENATAMVAELVRRGETGGRFFQDACALVKYGDLPAETRRWFEEQGILILREENVVVSLRHSEDFNFGTAGCHEVGEALIYGVPLKGRYPDLDEEPEFVSNFFLAMDATEKFPGGSWANVVIWGNRLRFTLCGSYVTGTGHNARGIMVPALGTPPNVYWHTANSFEPGRAQRNFYIHQSGFDPYAEYGLYALGKHLKGKIPSLSGDALWEKRDNYDHGRFGGEDS